MKKFFYAIHLFFEFIFFILYLKKYSENFKIQRFKTFLFKSFYFNTVLSVGIEHQRKFDYG